MDEKEMIEELTKVLGPVDPEMRPAVLRFAIDSTTLRIKMQNSTDLEELENLCIQRIVDPIISAAALLPNPVKLLGQLFTLDGNIIVAEFTGEIITSALSEEEKERVIAEIDKYESLLISKLYIYINRKAAILAESDVEIDNVISSWLYDLIKFKKDGNKAKLSNVKKGIINTWHSMKSYTARQNSVFKGMLSNAKTPNDISIWYSRYTLVPAIENAKDGYVKELTLMTTLTDEQIINDCVHLANELGISAGKEDFNIEQVRRSIRQLCKARTGYANPSVFLMSLLSESEMVKLLPLFPNSEAAQLKRSHTL